MELFTIMLRTLFFYFFIVLAYRIMGKREIGQLGILDLIVSILIAELVAISIENTEDPMMFTILPIALLVLLELGLAFLSIKSRTFRAFLDGKPSLIICNGKINFKEMIHQRYSMDDMLLHLRQQGIKSVDEVEYAFLEPNGKLSVFKYNLFKTRSQYPMPLIVDGQIQQKALFYIKKTKTWLLEELKKRNLNLEDVFYGFYKGKKVYIIKRKDLL